LNDPQRSLAVLRRLTPLFSAEFAIRPFLEKHTDSTLRELTLWCNDANEQVRRLVSEGTRPRLPWGRRLKLFIDDPTPVLSLLERLKDDPSEYVRRSVANNLNDIAKDHPQTVIKRCADWTLDGNDDRAWVVRHATRTLVKQGYPGVYKLLEYTEKPKVSIKALKLNPVRLSVGDSFTMSFELVSENTQTQNLVVDYAVHHIKANGGASPKIFKLKNVTIGAGEKLPITKKHSLRKVTTRRYYPGRHMIEILVNGKPMARRSFILLNL
jgi:3-methyladenine DNA glycosylase AlkC